MNILQLSYVISQMLGLYQTLIIIWALTSWFPQSRVAASIRDLLGIVCEPFVGLVRRFLPAQATGASGVDVSPLVAMLILYVLQYLVLNLIR